jgi:hypothetical protein
MWITAFKECNDGSDSKSCTETTAYEKYRLIYQGAFNCQGKVTLWFQRVYFNLWTFFQCIWNMAQEFLISI